MAVLRVSSPYRDRRTGMVILRKRVPQRYLSVADQAGGIVKISTGCKDDRAAAREWPNVLRRYAEMEAEWERRLGVVSLTPETAAEMAAHWAAWVMADLGRLQGDPEDAWALDDGPEAKLALSLAGDAEGVAARGAALLDGCAAQAVSLAGIAVAPETMGHLLDAMRPVVVAACRQAGLRDTGIVTAVGGRWNPLQVARAALPPVPDAPAPGRPKVSLSTVFDAWKAVTTAKPRTVVETRYVLNLLEQFAGHDDAATMTRDDLRGWRDAAKAGGVTNNTWNNRLSLVRQVFAQAVADGRLSENPADNALRLSKSKAAVRLPYSDEDAARLLEAARKETVPSLRWAPWIMAFTGMRAGEVLQLFRGDVRRDGAIWFLAVHEDDDGKSVKTGERRNVPLHPALVAEGFTVFVETLDPDAALFPERRLNPATNKSGRRWDVDALGTWAKDVAGIKDRRKAPNHSWRHRVEDELRAVEVPEDVRDAIVGHARRTTGRLYGLRGEALARLHRELAKLPVPVGIHTLSPGEATVVLGRS